MYLMINVLEQNFLPTQPFPAKLTISREQYLGNKTRQVVIVTQIMIHSERLIGEKFLVHDPL